MSIPGEIVGLPARLAGLRRCIVMGVLNLTPDSFSDGGQFYDADQSFDPHTAIAAGRMMLKQGADIIDVGAESTRPGAERISEADEIARVLPVVSALVDAGAVVSVDTMRATTADAAVGGGAHLINDVSGGLADPQMLGLLTQLTVPYVLMHWRGPSATMDTLASYTDVTTDVVAHLRARLDAFERAGIDPGCLILDPGLGFAKTAAHNWELLAHYASLASLGRPLLIGHSRKRFLGETLADLTGVPRAVDQRDAATTALTAVLAGLGAWGVRVHDVAASADAVRVVEALADARHAATVPWVAGEGV